MKITVERERTIGDLLEDIHARFGTRKDIEEHLEENPRDWAAKVALHDLSEYGDADPDEELHDTCEIFLGDGAIGEITTRRIHLLLRLQREGGTIEGVRALARALDRDVKNVSQDVQTLRQLGLLHVEEQGPGRPHILSLPGKRILLHLLEPGPD